MAPLLGGFSVGRRTGGAGGAPEMGSSGAAASPGEPVEVIVPGAGNRGEQRFTVSEALERRDELSRMASYYEEGSSIRDAILGQRDRVEAALTEAGSQAGSALALPSASYAPNANGSMPPTVRRDNIFDVSDLSIEWPSSTTPLTGLGSYSGTYFANNQPVSGRFEPYRQRFAELDASQWANVTSLLDGMNLAPDTVLYRGVAARFLEPGPDGQAVVTGSPQPSGALINTLNPPQGREFGDNERTFLPLFTASVNERGSGSGPYISARQAAPGAFFTSDLSIAEGYGRELGEPDQTIVSLTLGDLLDRGYMPYKDRDVPSALYFRIPEGQGAPVRIMDQDAASPGSGQPGDEARTSEAGDAAPASDPDSIFQIARENSPLMRRPDGDRGPFTLREADAVTRGASVDSPLMNQFSRSLTDPATGGATIYGGMSEATSAISVAMRDAQLAAPTLTVTDESGLRSISLAEQELGVMLVETRDPATGQTRVSAASALDTGARVFPGTANSIRFGDVSYRLTPEVIAESYGGGSLSRVRFVHTHPIMSTRGPGDPNLSFEDLNFAVDRMLRLSSNFDREIPTEMASVDLLSGVVVNVHLDRALSTLRYSVEPLTPGAPLPYLTRIDHALVRTSGMPGAENQTIQSRESYVQNLTERLTWLLRGSEEGGRIDPASIRRAAEAQVDSALESADDLPRDLVDAMEIIRRRRMQ